jgi:hypothetical protein
VRKAVAAYSRVAGRGRVPLGCAFRVRVALVADSSGGSDRKSSEPWSASSLYPSPVSPCVTSREAAGRVPGPHALGGARTTQSVFGQFRGFIRLGCTLGGSPGIFG